MKKEKLIVKELAYNRAMIIDIESNFEEEEVLANCDWVEIQLVAFNPFSQELVRTEVLCENRAIAASILHQIHEDAKFMCGVWVNDTKLARLLEYTNYEVVINVTEHKAVYLWEKKGNLRIHILN